MHGRSQVALLCGRGAGDAQAPEDSAALQIEVRRGELHRMAWYHTPVQGVEPARVPVVPGALAHQRVAADAIMPRLRERAVGDLVHPHRAGCRPVQLERLDRKSTRLNSSHSQISYAVFCLKKKKKAR